MNLQGICNHVYICLTAIAGHAASGTACSGQWLQVTPYEKQRCRFHLLLQGTLRQALDAGLLVNKGTGCHYLPTVLSLAHNIACAMHYLHQVRISPLSCIWFALV
jgi:hypothetical protein